jgi:predicted nucleic acid-binding protein
VEGVVPELAHVEVANALLVRHRSGALRLDDVMFILDRFLKVPLSVVPSSAIIEDAVVTAAVRDLSVYDACYTVLAEAPGTVLVTADRKLAGATGQSVLLT